MSTVAFAQGCRAVPVLSSDSGLMDLSELITQRLSLMEEVSKAKWNTGSAIEDAPREQTVLEEVEAKAAKAGLPPEWVQHFFRMQIEAGKLVQYQLFSEWRKSNHGKFVEAKDLKSQIRPQLDEMANAILATLKVSWPALKAMPVHHDQPVLFEKSAKFPRACQLAVTPLFDGSVQTAP